MCRAHLSGQLEAEVVDVGDDDVACADESADTGRHDTDGAGAGNEHILAYHGEGKRAMRRIAEGIEAGGNLRRDLIGNQPQVRCRNGDVLGECAVAVDSDSFRMGTQMTASRTAVAARAAGDVAFRRDAVGDGIVVHAETDLDDFSDELVTDDQRRVDRALRPFVPVVNVQIRPADGSLLHLDEHLVGRDRRHGNVLHPDPGLRGAFDQCFHAAHVRLADDPVGQARSVDPCCWILHGPGRSLSVMGGYTRQGRASVSSTPRRQSP